jgi:hypothetical protein
MKFIVASLIPLVAASVAHSRSEPRMPPGPKERAPVQETVRQAMPASAVAIEFQPGQAILTDQHREKIQEMIRQAPAQGDNMRLTIAAWSDQPYTEEQRQSTIQQQLAQRRLENVKNYVEGLGYQGSLDGFSMARQDNWLARLLNSDEHEIKSLFAEGVDVPDGALEGHYRAVKEQGKESHVVIVLSRHQGML